MVNFILHEEACGDMRQAPSGAYHSVIQPSLTVTVAVKFENVHSWKITN